VKDFVPPEAEANVKLLTFSDIRFMERKQQRCRPTLGSHPQPYDITFSCQNSMISYRVSVQGRSCCWLSLLLMCWMERYRPVRYLLYTLFRLFTLDRSLSDAT